MEQRWLGGHQDIKPVSKNGLERYPSSDTIEPYHWEEVFDLIYT